MKKWLVTVVTLLSFLSLSACSSSQASTDWLEGDWYSEEWQVTYTIEEADGKWTILDAGEKIAEGASLSQKDKQVTLLSKDGTEFRIEKISDKELSLQQVAAEGKSGTTASVSFTKK